MKVSRKGLAGAAAGSLIGVALVVGIGQAEVPNPTSILRPLDVLHTPSLFVPPNQSVTLNYEVVCARAGHGGDVPPPPCSVSGTAYVRAIGGSFAPIPLVLTSSQSRTLSATVPATYTAGAGFEYYVQIQDDLGNSMTVPVGGSTVPQHAWTVSTWTIVALGSHAFGQTQSPSSTAASAGWGKLDDQVGLDSGISQASIGPSAFDIAPNGSVVVLDQVNHRLALFLSGGVRKNWPIGFAGGEGDLVVAGDGTIYVLDQGGSTQGLPFISAFNGSNGNLISGVPLAEPVADMLRVGANGPVTHAYPSEMWFPTGTGPAPLQPNAQIAAAKNGLPVSGGREVVVSVSPSRTEARFALVSGNQVLQRWLVTSATNIGEVQLAEPRGTDGLVVAFRLYTDSAAELKVLRLTPTGLAESFAIQPVDSVDAAIGTLRLRGGSLYHMRSDVSAGMTIVTFPVGG